MPRSPSATVRQRRKTSRTTETNLESESDADHLRDRSHSLTSDTDEVQDKPTVLLSQQPNTSKWQSWWRRFWTTWVMLIAWFLLIFQGKQLGVIFLILVVQANIYRELVLLAIRFNKEKQLPGFNFFYYYWFSVFVLFIYCRTLSPHFEAHDWLSGTPWISWILRNYVAVSFCLYTAGFVAFVISLRKRRLYRYQFSQFAYCHMALFMVVWQSTFLVANVFQGMIWMVLPASLVICNDIWAYIFGFFFGRTPLIRLSPKKTWEGFIGAFVATVIWAFMCCRFLESSEILNTKYLMLCPKVGFNPFEVPNCDLSSIHGGIHAYYPLGDWWFSSIIPTCIAEWEISEMQLHSVLMGIFASLVAPFGGFFASGFKRAFKIKDFGQSIPGHGGFTDRMDCQIVMGSFAYIYCWHFLGLGAASQSVATATLEYLVSRSLMLDHEQKLKLIEALQVSLGSEGNPQPTGIAASGI